MPGSILSFVERLTGAAGLDGESPHGSGPDGAVLPGEAPDPGSAGLAFPHRADLPVAPGASVYALFPAGLDPASVQLLTAEELVASLAAPTG